MNSRPALKNLLISTATNSIAEFKLALRHFYKDNAEPLQITRRTLTDGTTLQELRPTFGAGNLINLVYTIIERFNSLYNFAPSKKMTPAQIEDLAAEMVLDFLERKQTPVTFEEIAIFFDRAGRNEFINPRTGRGFIFDRIDKSVIYEIMDFYFEDQKEGRTAAVWSLQDEIEKRRRDPSEADKLENGNFRNAPSDEPKSIEDLVKGKSHLTAKGLRELHEKYGK